MDRKEKIVIMDGKCNLSYKDKTYTSYALEITFKKTKAKKLNKRTGNVVWFVLYSNHSKEAMLETWMKIADEEGSSVDWESLKKERECLEFLDMNFLSLEKPFQDLILADLNRERK